MIITLDDSLSPQASRWGGPTYIRDSILSKLGTNAKYVMISGPDVGGNDLQTSYLEMISRSYSAHHSVRVAPHDLWYIVMCEIAATINAHPEAFRDLFTTSSEKVSIKVSTPDPTYLPLDAIIDQLRKHVPGDVDLFIPNFSTHDTHSRFACYAAFADAVKSYYSYMTFCCGLPAVEFTGTIEDWDLFGDCLTKIALMLKPVVDALPSPAKGQTKLVSSPYFHRILTRIEQISNLIQYGPGEGREDFVQDFYSHRNVGSGGEKDMTGWLGEFYAAEKGRLDHFNPCLSIVPYRNIDTQTDYTVVYGSFHNSVDDRGVRTAHYGGLVFRHDPIDDVKSGSVNWNYSPVEYEGRWPVEGARQIEKTD